LDGARHETVIEAIPSAHFHREISKIDITRDGRVDDCSGSSEIDFEKKQSIFSRNSSELTTDLV
jgi:hypothetical protein